MAVTINNAEIRNLQIGPTIVTDGLVSYWAAASRLSYPRAGSVWYDLILANRNNGSLINMSGTNFTEDGQGALVFDGADEYMSVPSSESLNFDNGPFTVSIWVEMDSSLNIGSGSYLLGKRGLGTLSKAGWMLTADKDIGGTTWKLTASIYDGSTGGYRSSGFALDFNHWYMLTVSYNIFLSRLQLYIYNIPDTALNFSPSLGSVNNSIPVELCGTLYMNHSHAGGAIGLTPASIGSVALYNKTLTDEEINEQFLATKGRWNIG